MVSKNQIKIITGLQQKKYRREHGLFIAEGIKVVQELLNSNFELQHLYTTEPLNIDVERQYLTEITESELKKISALTTPNTCLALFKIPIQKEIVNEGLIMALDDVRDPGNLGTIIRLCDWFGIKQLVCSQQCADLYNTKVVQATMGSLARVNLVYTDLKNYLQQTELPVYGTFMDGENVYRSELPEKGVVIMGNEANGISSDVENEVKHRIAIPRFGDIQKTESLNVATAAAIILSEFRRNFSGK
jgi:TrmH family RNA methyltransferase